MVEDAKILRKLAQEYAVMANSEQNEEKKKLHRAVNSLRQIRPVVLIDEIPWNEMNIEDELTVLCKEPYLKEVEWFFRTKLYQNKYMPADMILPSFLPVQKVVHHSGIGITVEEEVRITDEKNHIISHEYKDILQTEADLEKIHPPVLTYDHQETMRRYQLAGEILGDILPIKLEGTGFFYITYWDQIARYRGVTNLLMDLVERPEFTHKVVKKFQEIALSIIQQTEDLGLIEPNPSGSLHCTSRLVDDLPQKDNQEKHTRKDVWGRGMAQIFGTVSKEMHEEFDIQYMLDTIGSCGLSYYGCCEPLDKKIDLLEKIPNLRKISITPWADVDVAAEAINHKYVLASKPNPAAVAVPMLDKENLKKEISKILAACKRNNCACDIVLKDISTCSNRPQNIFEWEKTVMELVENTY